MRWIAVVRLAVTMSVAASKAIAFDASPQETDRGIAIVAEVVLSGASAIIAFENGRLAHHGDRSLRSSLAGIAIGTGTLSIAAARDAKIWPFGVAAGMAAIVTSVARLPRHTDRGAASNASGGIQFHVGFGSLAMRMGF